MDQPDIESRRRRPWSELTTGQQMALAGAAAVQIGLAVAAWTDLIRRPASRVHGPKLAWAAVIAVNFVGPISYFVWGRTTDSTETLPTSSSADNPAGHT